jgi:xanthine/uracil permease
MKMREGIIPTVLGTVVTATGLSLKPLASRKLASKKLSSNIAWGVAGFGLAHVVLGAIDLIEHRNRN